MSPRPRLSRLVATAEQAHLPAGVGPRSRTNLGLALLCASLLALALTAAPASALKTHLFSTSFGTSGSGAGQLSLSPANFNYAIPFSAGSGIAVNSTTHDVYLADTGNHRVDQFSSSGAFIRAWGWGVADGSAAFQTCTATCQAGISGSGAGQFESPLSVAVDNSGGASKGDVYVSDAFSLSGPGTDLVQKFDSSGNLISTWANGGQLDGSAATGGPFSGEIAGIATDPSGNLFVDDMGINNSFDNVFQFAPDGTPAAPTFTAGIEYPVGLATDPSGNLYRGNGNAQVEKLDTSGNLLGTISNTGVIGVGLVVDPSNSDVYIDDQGSLIRHYAIGASGSVIEPDNSLCPVDPANYGCGPSDSFGSGNLSNAAGLALDPATKSVYAADTGNDRVAVFAPGILADLTTNPASNVQKTSAALNGHLDPAGGSPVKDCHFEYVTDAAFQATGFTDLSSGGTKACDQSPPISVATDVNSTVTGLTAATTYRYRLVVSNSFGTTIGSDQPFTTLDAVTALSTDPATNVTNTSADLHGSYTGDGLDTQYYFQYGASNSYGHTSPAPPGADNGLGAGPQTVSPIAISGLEPGATYHYRIVATNSIGTTFGPDATFTTDHAPTIDAFSTSNVTATSADLNAQINPQGFDTTYRFEYGTSTSYGTTTPDTDAGSAGSDQSVSVHLTGLQGVVYHFRVVATNKWGTVTSADQTFEFFPPNCPNSAVRQQTGSAYLPDCRAYELVSPPNANGTLLFSGGPNTGQATSPSRFSFTGAFSALPGTNPINTAGDLYVSTRTDQGWDSRYIGLPGDQAGCMGGPPNDPRSNLDVQSPPFLTNTVLSDPTMSRFLIWLDGTPVPCVVSNVFSDQGWAATPPSNAPYMFNSDGTLAQRLPNGLDSVSGALDALKCPYPELDFYPGICSGDVAASADLSHLAFSSNSLAFAPGGLTAAPGSAYDNDVAANAVTLISKLANGDPIPQDAGFATVPAQRNSDGYVQAPGGKEEYIRFPAVSADGSHILMSTATAITPRCEDGAAASVPCQRYIDNPLHLYMRVNDALTYEIAPGHAVNYVGTTPDGSKVYFTSPDQLTADDTDTSTDLYMWSEATNSLTRISAAANGAAIGAGDTDNCSATWTTNCGVVPYSGWSYSWLRGGRGGNGISDSAIASQNGDIYFYSPEQLDGDRGVLGQQNLYVYRGGRAQYVTTLAPGSHCTVWYPPAGAQVCSDGPIVRLNVSPDDSHMAFVTDNRLTSYDNAGHLEMYSYTPATGAIVCDSCRPDGQPPSDDVEASQDGLFMTNDGRTFFSTTDPLVPQDTNQGTDVYEFVDGRPQLITPGTGTFSRGFSNVLQQIPGLVAVSADGSDVYLSTRDSLVPQDQNGSFLKFYDARSGGGFATPTPVPPCAAAEECHGPGSSPPAAPQVTSDSTPSSGGNATPNSHAHHHKKHHKRAHKRHHARSNRGGKK